MNMRRRLIISILLPIIAVSVLSLACMRVFIHPYLEALLLDQMENEAEHRMRQFGKIKSQLYIASQSIIGDNTIQSMLLPSTAPVADRTVLIQIIRPYIFDDIVNIIYASSNLTYILHAYQSEDTVDWARDLIDSIDDQSNYARPVWMSLHTDDSGLPDIFVMQKIRHIVSDTPPAYLLIQLRAESLKQIVMSGRSYEHIYIRDGAGQVVFTSSETGNTDKLPSFHGKTDRAETSYDSSRGIVTTAYRCSRTGWGIYSYAEYGDMMSHYNRLESTIAIIAGSILLSGSVSILSLTFLYTKPIKTMTDAIKSFRSGRFKIRVDTKMPAEFKTIGSAFNFMADHIEKLIEDLGKSREDLMIAELNSLMYQINPHFVYNTLDNLYMLARTGGPPALPHLIHSLARFLRISLSKGSSIIKVKDEIEHVSSFLTIQQIRYGDLFTYEANISEDAARQSVLKFILQPLAENAIRHGFSEMETGGKIVIDADIIDQNGETQLRLRVTDNGVGMSPDVIRRLESINDIYLEKLANFFEGESGYGIGSVMARLWLYYQNSFKISFENLNPGTQCSIFIQCQIDKQ